MENNNQIPLYQQIKNDILFQIKNNLLRPGDKLPSEQTFTTHYHVSRITVSKALNELREEGFLLSFPGKGTFVSNFINVQQSDLNSLQNNTTSPAGLREIAYICPSIQDLFAVRFANGVQSAFRSDNYIFHIFLSQTPAIEKQLLHYCMKSNISGIVLFPHENSDASNELLAILQQNFPLVLVDHPFLGLDCSYVGGDHELGGSLCIKHLHKLGHNRIVFVTDANRNVLSINQRILGCQKRFEKYNTSSTLFKVVENIDVSRKPFYYFDFFKKLIYTDKVTAFIASSTHCCNYLYHVFNSMNLKIPNDISLMSFDNPQTDFSGMNYFTHINQSEFTIGREAGNTLRQSIESEYNNYVHKLIPPELVVSSSTDVVL